MSCLSCTQVTQPLGVNQQSIVNQKVSTAGSSWSRTRGSCCFRGALTNSIKFQKKSHIHVNTSKTSHVHPFWSLISTQHLCVIRFHLCFASHLAALSALRLIHIQVDETKQG